MGRQAVGKSSSALMRQANKMFARGVVAANVAKGVSSVVGSLYVTVLQPTYSYGLCGIARRVS